jgi:two-component sensor histidine kinase/chemotaxis methyl-accepting protein methylase
LEREYELFNLIDELSKHRDIDLFSFNYAYIRQKIEIRLVDLEINEIDYLHFIDSNPSEADQFYWNYLYNLKKFQIPNLDVDELTESIREYIIQNKISVFKSWFPMNTNRGLYLIFHCLLETLKKENLIESYHLYVTHPNKEKISDLRSNRLNESNQLVMKQEWIQNYFILNDSGYWEMKPEIRLCSIFANHDPLIDIPFKSLDLIIVNDLWDIFSGIKKNHIIRQYFESLRSNGMLLKLDSKFEQEINHLFETKNENKNYTIFFKRNDLSPASKKSIYTPFRYNKPEENNFENIIRRAFFRSEDVAYALISEDDILVEISENFSSYIELKEGSLSYKVSEVFDSEFSKEILEIIYEHKETKKPVRKNLNLKSKNIKGRFNQFSIQTIHLPNSSARFYAIFFWNSIPESKEENREKYERAIREIHHRVKNQMTIIFSLLDLESNENQNTETQALINRMTSRIHAIEIIQNRLSEDPFTHEIELKTILQDYINYISSMLFKHELSIPIEYFSDSTGIMIQTKLASPILLCMSEILSYMVRNLLNKKQEGFHLEIQCKGMNQSISIRMNLVSHLRNKDYEWIEMENLGKSILEANSKQMKAKIIGKSSKHHIEYILNIPLL